MNLLQKTKGFMKSLWKDEAGQGMVEYGLILALVAIVVIGALTLIGTDISAIFTDISNNLKNTSGTEAPAA
jgi:pilus assembly protein Flp/PilA